MRIIRCQNHLTAVLSDGRIVQTSDCTDEVFEKIQELQKAEDEMELINLLIPEEKQDREAKARILQLVDNVKNSGELIIKGDSVYWEGISPLSMPQTFAEKVLEAEKTGNEAELTAYRNFWTLLSLNPDPTVRENLFKFLFKWGMVITKSGLFVGYRNVQLLIDNGHSSENIYTDVHSGTTRIQIGKMVTLSRKLCDSNSDHECSAGLHIGGTSWLKKNYFGEIGLACLVNPIDVVAVPWCNATYGKLRTCAYLPISIARYKNQEIIPFRDDSGFEEPFVQTILYDGIMSEEEKPLYTINIPGEENYKSVSDKILAIARQFMKGKEQ